jgi:hypothetical protein
MEEEMRKNLLGMLALLAQSTAFAPRGASITRSTRASVDGVTVQFASSITENLGEDIKAGQPMCFDETTNKFWKFNSPSAAAANRVLLAGVANRDGKAGQPMTANQIGVIFGISGTNGTGNDGTLLRGRVYFASATPGEIDDVASAVDTVGAFYAVSKQDLELINIGKLA